MKYLITFFLLFNVAFAQNWIPMSSNYKYRGLKADSILGIPRLPDTSSAIKSNGYIVLVDSVFYYYFNKWRKIEAISIDTSSLSNRINQRVKYTDTASMLNPYLRKIDTASLSNRINLKLGFGDTSFMLSPYLRKSDTSSLSNRINLKLNISDTSNMLNAYLRKVDTLNLSNRINQKLNISDTASMLSAYLKKVDTLSLSNRINLRLNISDTANMLSKYLRKVDTASLSLRINDKVDSIKRISTNVYFYKNGIQYFGFTDSIGGSGSGFVPYTGATQDVDLGGNGLTARFVKITGTAGSGHLDLKHQSGDATGQANSTKLYANASGYLKWKNDNQYYSTLAMPQTADRVYTYQNKSYTLGDSADISARVKYTDTASMLSPYLRGNTASATYLAKSDSSTYQTKYRTDTMRTNIYNSLNGKVKYADTATMLSPYLRSNIATATYLAKSDSTIFQTKYRSDTGRANIYNVANNYIPIKSSNGYSSSPLFYSDDILKTKENGIRGIYFDFANNSYAIGNDTFAFLSINKLAEDPPAGSMNITLQRGEWGTGSDQLNWSPEEGLNIDAQNPVTINSNTLQFNITGVINNNSEEEQHAGFNYFNNIASFKGIRNNFHYTDANYSIDYNDYFILAATSDNSVTLTLPEAVAGQTYIIKKRNAENDLKINSESGNYFEDGTDQLLLTNELQYVQLIADDGGTWYIVASN